MSASDDEEPRERVRMFMFYEYHVRVMVCTSAEYLLRMKLTAKQLRNIIRETIDEVSDAESDWERLEALKNQGAASLKSVVEACNEVGIDDAALAKMRATRNGYNQFFFTFVKAKGQSWTSARAHSLYDFFHSQTTLTEAESLAAEYADLSSRFIHGNDPDANSGDPYYRSGGMTTHKPSGKTSSWREDYRSPSTYRDRKRVWR